jgi:GNAT superfamily N-acetyltransferase
MEIQWHELTDTRSRWVDQCLALYEQTFPDEVREPDEVLLRGVSVNTELSPNAFHFLIALNEQQEVVGFSTAHYLADVQFGFVVYLLVNPAIRSRGLGGHLLAHMQNLLKGDAARFGTSLRGVILETEKEADAHTEVERAECRRRNRFFNRQGYGRVESVFYVQPPLRETTSEVSLHLYVHLQADQRPLTGEELRRVVHAMYEQKYSKINHVDSRTLRTCEKQLRVPAGLVIPAFEERE